MRSGIVLAIVVSCALGVGEDRPLLARQSNEYRAIGSWKNFTDMKSVRMVALGGSDIVAATSGGLFIFHRPTGSFTTITNSEGLASIDLTAVTVLDGNQLWMGAGDGMINVLVGSAWREIRDIKESVRIQKAIRSFMVFGTLLYISTDFGIVEYKLDRMEFGDTFANLGFPSQARVNRTVIHDGKIWAATDQGVAVASLSSTNLSSPTAWTQYRASSGLPSQNVLSLAIFKDTLVAGTSSGLAYFSGSGFQANNGFSGRSVADLRSDASELKVLSNSGGTFSIDRLSSMAAPPVAILQSAGSGQSLIVDSAENKLSVGTASNGLYIQDEGFVSPDGPASSFVISIDVDDEGVVWCGSGIDGNGKGFYRYNPTLPSGNQWKPFDASTYAVMAFNDYYKASVTGSRTWISSWGRGVVEVVGDTIRRRLDHLSVPSLAGALAGSPSFVIVGSVRSDQNGDTWFVNRTAINGNYLARLVNDTTFVYYKNELSPTVGLFTSMVIDGFGTKWLANSEPKDKPSTGLYFFNESRIVAGTENSGGWGQMTESDGLPSNKVLSLAVDIEGDVCIGTDLGLMIITDPRSPRVRRVISFPLREQSIQTIAVDPLNNKWVGTKEGVFVVSPDGTQLLHHYSVLTTGGMLIDNDVRSIGIDHTRGIVYMGTERGLSSLQIGAVRSLRGFTTLQLGPNPYLIPNPRELVIANLVANSTVKILTASGSLISEFKAQGGGRAFWNGTADSGEQVSSGIYFVVAFAENGEKVATAKVAVIRK